MAHQEVDTTWRDGRCRKCVAREKVIDVRDARNTRGRNSVKVGRVVSRRWPLLW